MIFDKVFAKMKNTSMIRNGIEVFNIAKEVYNIVNKTEPIESNKTLISAEEIYVAAVQKVTQRSEKKIKAQIDYKVVHYSAQTFRKTQSIARSTKKIIKRKYNGVKNTLHTRINQIKGVSSCGYTNCKRKLLNSHMMRSEFMKSIQNQLIYLKMKSYTFVKEIYKQIDNFVGFDECKQIIKNLISNIKNRFDQTLKIITSAKNTTVNIFKNNMTSTSKVAIYSFEFTKRILQADIQALSAAIDTNKELLLGYLKNIELEMYYSPDQSIRLVETLRKYATIILNGESSEAVPHSSANKAEE